MAAPTPEDLPSTHVEKKSKKKVNIINLCSGYNRSRFSLSYEKSIDIV